MTTEKQIKDQIDCLSEIRETIADCPSGYLKCVMSTRGKLFAPPYVYVRNFSPSEMTTLTLCPIMDLPIKKAEIYNGMIIGPNNEKVDINKWHKKEVEELDIFILQNFYTDVLIDLPYTPTEEDLKALEVVYGGKDSPTYKSWKADFDAGNITYKFNYNLASLQFTDLENVDFKHRISVVNKHDPNNTKIVFDLPRYGDYMMLKRFTDRLFKKKDKQLSTVAAKIENKREARERYLKGENVAYNSIETPDQEDIEAYNEYTYDRTGFAVLAAIASYIVSYGDQSLEDLPLEEKMKFVQGNPLITSNLLTSLEEKSSSLVFGHSDEITIRNPINGQETTIEFPFRDAVVLEAIRTARPSEFDICFE